MSLVCTCLFSECINCIICRYLLKLLVEPEEVKYCGIVRTETQGLMTQRRLFSSVITDQPLR